MPGALGLKSGSDAIASTAGPTTSATGTTPDALTPKGPFMALTDTEQANLLTAVAKIDRTLHGDGNLVQKIDVIGMNVNDIEGGVAGLPSLIAQVDNPDVDNAAIAAAVVAAVPAAISQQVVDLLLARLSA